MMEQMISHLLESFEQGRMTRRELVAGLAGLTSALAAAAGAETAETALPGETAPTFRVRAINHLALRSTDVARARDWYRDHLGMTVTRDSASSCFLSFDQGFLAIFRGEQAGLDHFCFSVPDYDPDAVMTILEKGGFNPRRQGNRIYFDDPDGLEVQLADLGHEA
jgi:hypothetical protein